MEVSTLPLSTDSWGLENSVQIKAPPPPESQRTVFVYVWNFSSLVHIEGNTALTFTFKLEKKKLSQDKLTRWRMVCVLGVLYLCEKS